VRAVPRLVLALICAFPIWLGIGLILISPTADAQSDQPLVMVADIDGPITPVIARYVHRAVDKANDRSAETLVITLNTPGGLSTAMDDIVDDIVRSDVPVVVYVSPINARAASAGVYITYASHIAVMAPSTNIGSASPIMTGSSGNITTDETLERKVMNDAIARITNLAELRGRNVEWAVSAVKDAANITSQQALDLGVIDLIEPDLTTLLADINGRTVTTEAGHITLNTTNARVDEINLGLIERFLQLLAEPTLAYLLVSFGLLALYIELSNPGLGVPGIFGGIALLLGLLGLGSLPVAWVGLGLMVLAFALFIADLFVPSLGMLTIGGLVSFVIGSNILIAEGSPRDLQVPQPIVYTMTACLAVAAALLGMAVVRVQFRRTQTGKAGMIGQVGVARTRLAPDGMVLVFGEIWSATSPEAVIEVGEHVAVTAVNGLSLDVRPATAEEVIASVDTGDRRAIIPVR
jgi:membrane-bound serine protease (ClpP class)